MAFGRRPDNGGCGQPRPEPDGEGAPAEGPPDPGEVLRELPQPLFRYLEALQADGFTRDEAFGLVRDAQVLWLDDVFGGSRGHRIQ